MIIRISGRARVSRQDGRSPLSKDIQRKLDGAKSKDKCGNYIDSDLAELGITGGTVKLLCEAPKGGFRVTTEYTSPVKLNRTQLKKLANNTTGQWSDGIGESCFDKLADRLGVMINLLQSERSVKIEQIDDGKRLAKPKTSLAKAAEDDDLAAVLALLEAGANTETRLEGFTPLHLALSRGYWEIALELMNHGADVLAHDPRDFDPLLITAMSKSLKDEHAAQVATELLKRGAPVTDPEYGECTPLYRAKQRKKKKLMSVLKKFGARS